ncbi:MAG: asparaginase [Albidovulum sp.]
MAAAQMIELWRGGTMESQHAGHAVICDEKGAVIEAWGDPDAMIFPRSSCKMIQDLPLIESGAAAKAGLRQDQLALCCASHRGALIHTVRVEKWLADLGLSEADLRCGSQVPLDAEARDFLYSTRQKPCQCHNCCSGKHAGFLTLSQHLGGDADYNDLDHPVQRAIKAAFEETTGMTSPGHGIDGCSAPNHLTSVQALGRAMAFFATAREDGSLREQAAHRLTQAMMAYPELVSGDGGACTNLMRAMGGRAAVKFGAEAVYVAILPEQKRSIALKILDGGKRASEAAITALLIRLGALEKEHPVVGRYLTGPQKNARGITTGELRLSQGFAQ